MRLFSVFILLFIFGRLNSQYLFQRFEGKSGNLLGANVAMTPDGNHLGIFNAINGQALSKIEIYELEGNTFVKRNEISSSPEIGNFFFSDDGKRLLVANGDANIFRLGSVSVFEKNNNSWVKLGNKISEITASNLFGQGLDFAGDGNTFVVSTPDFNGGNNGRGLIEVYTFDGVSWVLKGTAFNGNSGDRIGEQVSISENGNRIAYSSQVLKEIKVFDYVDNNWIQLGSTIIGSAGDVALSNDGKTLVCGGVGYVDTRIFNLVGSNWVKHNNTITHNSPIEGGWNVVKTDITSDVKHLILSYLNGSNQKTKFIVADNINNFWIQRDDEFYNSDKEEYYGISGEISDDGKLIAVGHAQSNYGGSLAGEVHCFVDNLRSYFYVKSFFDANKNGIQDNGELIFDNAKYSIDDAYTIIQNKEDKTFITLFGGQYKLSLLLPQEFKTTIDSTIIINAQVNNLDSMIFPIVPRFPTYIGNSNATHSNYLCNSQSNINIRFSNIGSEPLKVKVEISHENLLRSSSNPVQSSNDAFLSFWDLETIVPGISKNNTLTLQMPDETLSGNNINVVARINFYNTSDELVITDTINLTSILRCSFDPNDKAVNPEGIGPDNLSLISQYLSYKIRFQNTGNYPAENVIIEDKLSQHLDLSTFELIETSHKLYNTELKGQNLKFIFKDINLPDSVNNEPESHGYVIYRIKVKKNVPERTLIENAANIFFDLNKPVTTNTTKNMMVTAFPPIVNNEEILFDDNLIISPNPANNVLKIQSLKSNISSMICYNINGIIVPLPETFYLNENIILTNVNHLRDGVYLIKIFDKELNEIGTRTFIKSN